MQGGLRWSWGTHMPPSRWFPRFPVPVDRKSPAAIHRSYMSAQYRLPESENVQTMGKRNFIGIVEQSFLRKVLERTRQSRFIRPMSSSFMGYLIGMEGVSAPTHAGMFELCPFSGSHNTTSFSNEVGTPSCASRYIFRWTFLFSQHKITANMRIKLRYACL